MTATQKVPPNPKDEAEALLAKHGPRGHFVKLLYRFRMGGWVLSGILLTYLMFAHLVSIALPKPVMVVNDHDEIIGQIDYFNTVHRTDAELITAGKRFLQYRLSVNSETILEDVLNSLNVMAPPLRLQQQALLVTDVNTPSLLDPKIKRTYVLAVTEMKTRSHIEFDTGANAPRIVGERNGWRIIRYTGREVVIGDKKAERAFDMNVTLRATARNSKNTLGIEVEAFNDN
jgi:hypothetical protein